MNGHLDALVAQTVGTTALVGDDGDVGCVGRSSKRAFGWNGVEDDFNTERILRVSMNLYE